MEEIQGDLEEVNGISGAIPYMTSDDHREYRWETGYEKTWEALNDDKEDPAEANFNFIQKARQMRRLQKMQQYRLGMMRYLYIVLDCSRSMAKCDMKPSRFLLTFKLLKDFIKEFFEQNPLSQLGLIALENKRGVKYVELTSNYENHVNVFERIQSISLTGEPSLYNGIETAWEDLIKMPSHASREILILMSSLTTCDPIVLPSIYDELKNDRIRVSVITLSAEVYVCRKLVQATYGTFSSIIDDVHFRDQLMSHIEPPVAIETQPNSIIEMGFPHSNTTDKLQLLSMCMCHLSVKDCAPSTNGYFCPKCNSKYCNLPTECTICDLKLVSAPHLTRSYHHLFPIDLFEQLKFNSQASVCFACQHVFGDISNELVFRCKECGQIYCTECDAFIHDILHVCVGCSTLASTLKRTSQESAPEEETDEFK